MHTHIGRTRLELTEGDIADQGTDAIVTAAHWDLAGGQGTDGAVHFKAGPGLLQECLVLGGCPIGEAVITGGYQLRARHVIHAVGPVYQGGDTDEPELLASAYESSLRVATEHGLHSVSFPSLSTGAFCYPMSLAAPIALRAIVGFLERERHELDLVRVVLYPREDADAYTVYAQALQGLLRERSVIG